MNCVLPNIEPNYKIQQWLCERALLAPTNVEVNAINSSILSRIHGNGITYNSIDTVTNEDDAVNYPVEFLSSLDLPGFPPGLACPLFCCAILVRLDYATAPGLHLKIGEQSHRRDNYHWKVQKWRCVAARNSYAAFKFKRLQFPIRLAFAMAIKKAQGYTTSVWYSFGQSIFLPCLTLYCVFASWKTQRSFHLCSGWQNQKHCLSTSITIIYEHSSLLNSFISFFKINVFLTNKNNQINNLIVFQWKTQWRRGSEAHRALASYFINKMIHMN